jgi:hypothetical protein
VGLAPAALDPQAILAHGGEMRAARDECYISSSLGQCRTECSADAAGADYGYTHGSPPVSMNDGSCWMTDTAMRWIRRSVDAERAYGQSRPTPAGWPSHPRNAAMPCVRPGFFALSIGGVLF